MNKPGSIVLDSWAMMAYLQGEKAAKKVVDILADAHANGDSLLMSVVNAGEVWYTIAQRAGTDRAEEAIELLRSLGIKFIDIDWATTQIAASYKAKGKISYADCFAAALAKQTNSPIITGDPEFKQVEKEIQILWL